MKISKRSLGEDLTDEQIEYWQTLGHAEILRAVRELTLLGYLMQGLDARHLPMDRTLVERRVVPWSVSPSPGAPSTDEDA